MEAPRGQCRPAEEEEASAFEARMSARTAKVRELQQQIRDLAAQLADGARQREARRAGDAESQPAPALTAVTAPERAGRGRDDEESQEEEADRVLTEVEAGWFRGAAARANNLALDRSTSHSRPRSCAGGWRCHSRAAW